jgi:imidazoleglycerol-phosphate dehydratase
MTNSPPTPRRARCERRTAETAVACTLLLDGRGQTAIQTGVPFYDHLLQAFARHGHFDLELHCEGDLLVDDHHSVEDCALAIGECLDLALGERRGIARFGHAYAPLDEALVRAVVDLSGRPFARVELPFVRSQIGGLSLENCGHAMQSLATRGRLCLHVDCLQGQNDHHRAEAAWKAFGLALRAAVRRDGDAVPSTKGVL